MKILTVSLLSLIIISSFSGCAMVHRYGAFYGKVIDIETKEPLEGAAVLAIYYTESYGPAGAHTHYLDAQEAVTDKGGEFRIKPLTAKTFRVLHSFDPHVYFTIFNPGYGCYPWHKDVKPIFVPNGTLSADQYVTIELPKLRTIPERLTNTMIPLSSEIPIEKYIKLKELINQEFKNLGRAPIR